MSAFDMAWEYYKAASLVLGSSEPFLKMDQEKLKNMDREKLKNMDQEKLKNNQAPYSLHWFYIDPDIEDHCRASSIIKKLVTCRESNCTTSESGSRNPTFGTFGSQEPNSSQKLAIATALCESISVIYGPPGTGKTKVIIELMYRIYLRGKTAAIVSQNSSAIENIVEKLAEIKGIDDSRLQSFVNSVANLGHASKRKKFDDAQFRFNRGENGFEKEIEASDFLEEYPLIISTIHSLPKCFKDGKTHTYDYVIVDECSQVSPLVGMVAANNAKHLVLVGDPNQLPPVYSKEAEAVIERFIEDKHISDKNTCLTMRDERSFLDMGLEAIGGDRSPACVLLNEHYRCHPGIIKFCNQYIYDNRLEIKSASSGYSEVPDECRVPILVRWFEGNYGESFYLEAENKQGKYNRLTKRNLRQISIFMAEEWPKLIDRLKKDPELTVAVLSPYRGELESLKQAICNALKSKDNLRADISLQPLQDMSDQNEGADHDLIMLTIHKAQGREFDIVYLLPVDDGMWEWPWSQKRRLVNVALSRTKQELRIITSVNLMSKRVQQHLLGQSTEAVAPVAQGTAPLTKSDEDNMYIQYLINYVFDEYTKAGQFPNAYGFGFVRSKHISIFDKTNEKTGKNDSFSGGLSEPELCFAEQLAKTYMMRKDGIPLIANEYPLCNLDADSDCNQRFDYALINESLRVFVLAIEIDGIHHRYNKEDDDLKAIEEQDNKKNCFCKEKNGAVLTSLKRKDVEAHLATLPSFILLRLPVDGTSQYELSSLSSERSADFFTIDELYDRQLELITSKAVNPVPAIIGETVTVLAKNIENVIISPSELNKVLNQKGLIVKDRFTLLQSAQVECWRVKNSAKNEGSKYGIYNTLRIHKGKHYAYWVPRFNIDNKKFVRHICDKKDEV